MLAEYDARVMSYRVEHSRAVATGSEMVGETLRRGLFPYRRWQAALPVLTRRYSREEPFPYAHLVEFFDRDVANRIADEFPSCTSDQWVHWKHYNENKLGLTKRALFPPFLGQIVDELNSDSFLGWLSALTGIDRLVADPELDGGGLHQSGAGGFLNIHTDFSTHHHHPTWRRRVNLIVYLNRLWEESWGGAIELWDRDMRRSVVTIPPLFNHAIIFNTEQPSHHGFPEPLRCPEGVTRRSLALYYYTVATTPQVARSTDYRSRPGDPLSHRALIWADKKIVHLYSRAKSRLGLSDDFASAALRTLSTGLRRQKYRVPR
jgi:2-oxoglutarate-Fe(II)-dependent oxygenase superfamily protein